MATRQEEEHRRREHLRDESLHKVNCSGCPACRPDKVKTTGKISEVPNEKTLPRTLDSLKRLTGFDIEQPSSLDNQRESDK